MNEKVVYKKQSVMWSYALLLKTRELAQYLIGKRKKLDFSKPAYNVERQDSDYIRQKILSRSYSEWKKRGFSKDTIHYLIEPSDSLNR